jgi:hypothetical protein
MVLHELAHTQLLIPPDLGNSGQSQNDTQNILTHCLEAIQATLGGH